MAAFVNRAVSVHVVFGKTSCGSLCIPQPHARKEHLKFSSAYASVAVPVCHIKDRGRRHVHEGSVHAVFAKSPGGRIVLQADESRAQQQRLGGERRER